MQNRTASFCRWIFVGAVLCGFGGTVSAQNRTVIRLREETVIASEFVSLGELADISGSGEPVIARLKAVSLGYAPAVGMAREITREKILIAIRAAGHPPGGFNLIAPAIVIVRRAAQSVECDLLRSEVEHSILPRLNFDGVSARIVRMELPADFPVPKGKIEIRPSHFSLADLSVPIAVSLEIRVDQRIVRRVAATVYIVASADVLVADKDLAPGQKLDASHFRTENRKLEKPPASYVRKPDTLRGAVLVKAVRAGTVITTAMIMQRHVVHAGDPVRIVGQSGKTQIIAGGEARSSGRIGDRIAIKNSRSGAILQAIVVDEGLVKINF